MQPPPTHSTAQPCVPEQTICELAPTTKLHWSVPEHVAMQLSPHSPAQPSVPEHVSVHASEHTVSQRPPPAHMQDVSVHVVQPVPVQLAGPPGASLPQPVDAPTSEPRTTT